MKFCVVNLGCKVNRVESDAYTAALLSQGASIAPEKDADVIVINTCTVTGEAEKKTRKAVRRALRENLHAQVMVTGCAVAIDAYTYKAMDNRVQTYGKVELLEQITSGSLEGFAPHDSLDVLPVGEGFRTRVGVKVQDGCNNACTYCIVHVARGRATSRPADAIVSECVNLTRAGVREIVLAGINLGSYRDSSNEECGVIRLADLLKRLLSETADIYKENEPAVRFRISSIEPRDVDDALIDVLVSAEGRVCRHLHLPLQAGSSKVLREMARPYDAQRFCALVDKLYERLPLLALSTDIIVGFPGETQEDFEETLKVAQYCRFSKIHVFPYSRREGTPAAARSDQIPVHIKIERAAALRNLGESLREQEFNRRADREELALIEEGGIAMTESYFELSAPADAVAGSLIPVKFPS